MRSPNGRNCGSEMFPMKNNVFHINCRYEYFLRLENEVLSTRDGVRDLGITIDSKHHRSLQCSTVAEKSSEFAGGISAF